MLQEARAPACSEPDELRRALLDTARSDEPARVGALLDQAFAVLPLAAVLSEVVIPTLRWVGEEWQAGRLSIAHEHAVTARVRARLEQLMADQRGSVRGTAVLACAPGEQHDLGLLMLAVALRADGWRVEYLGANTPVDEAVAFAAGVGAAVVCFSASRPETVSALTAGIEALDDRRGLTLVVGGTAVRPVDVRALEVDHAPERLDGAVEQLRALTG